MPVPSLRARLALAVRSYVVAVLLNLALVSTVLRADDRPPVAQLRLIATGPGFRETELIRLDDGTQGVASLPYRVWEQEGQIGRN